jgi:hypothetical protein
MKAADLLKTDHPLHASLKAWTEAKGVEMTKRQARKFLASLPNRGAAYRRAA